MISKETKAYVKFLLAERFHIRRDIPTEEKGEFPHEMWSLQNVMYKLPTRKFAETFGPRRGMAFTDAMRQTGMWLRASGYTQQS